MSEMLNRVAAFGGDSGACGAADPDKDGGQNNRKK